MQNNDRKTNDLMDFYGDLCDKFGIKNDLGSDTKSTTSRTRRYNDGLDDNRRTETRPLRRKSDSYYGEQLSRPSDKRYPETQLSKKPVSEIVQEVIQETEQKYNLEQPEIEENTSTDILKNYDEEVLVIDNTNEIKPFQYANNEKIRYLAISSNVTKIGGFAFINCKNLENVVIESNRDFVDDELRAMFKGCHRLKDILVNGKLIEIKV